MTELDFLDPLKRWQLEYPNGFSDSRTPKVPILGRYMMIGSSVERGPIGFETIKLTVNLDDDHLELTIDQVEKEPFQGVIIEHYKMRTPDFSRLVAEVDTSGSEKVSIGSTDELMPLPHGEKRTPFGSLASMTVFALGHNSMLCFEF